LYASFRSSIEAVHPDDRARVDAATALLRSGVPFDERFRVVRPDGSVRWIRSRALTVPEATGGFRRMVGVAEDITQQKHSEEKLQHSERLLRVVLDALPVGVSLMDRCGDVVLSNPESRRIWGGAKRNAGERYAESKGWWHSTGLPLAPDDWASVRALQKGESTVNEVLDIENYVGMRKTIQNSAVPIHDEDDQITGAVIVNEDISARVAAERELNDSYNQMRALSGRLMRAQDDERRRIAQMLHETTAQDLAALKMHLARLNRTAASLSDSDRTVLLESISLAEQSMTEVRTLSYLLHPPFLDDMGLVSALRWYANGFSERSGIIVDLDLPEIFDRPPLDTETALFRIVQESLINIHRHAGSETASIRLQRDAETLVLAIEDRGRGIPSASLTQIMRGEGGVGVGIAGMHERIEQLGGTLEITSNGHGTIVRAQLPLMSRAE
jgi:PAS domain S-box-containing protein